MTDAKEPEVIEYLRQEARDGSVFLYNVRGGVTCAISVILDEFATLTRERDAAVKRRREIDDEAFDYAEQIETLRTQLAAARAVIEAAKAFRDSAHVSSEWHTAIDRLEDAVDALRALEGDA